MSNYLSEITIDLKEFENLLGDLDKDYATEWQHRGFKYILKVYNEGGYNVHGDEMWFYLKDGLKREVFLFCDYYDSYSENPLLFAGMICYKCSLGGDVSVASDIYSYSYRY